MLLPGTREERSAATAADDGYAGWRWRLRKRDAGVDWLGEYARGLDSVSAVEERRVEGALCGAFAAMGVFARVAAYGLELVLGTPAEERRAYFRDESAPRGLLPRDDFMAWLGSIRKDAGWEAGLVGSFECAGRSGGFWDLLSVVYMAASTEEWDIRRTLRLQGEGGGR